MLTNVNTYTRSARSAQVSNGLLRVIARCDTMSDVVIIGFCTTAGVAFGSLEVHNSAGFQPPNPAQNLPGGFECGARAAPSYPGGAGEVVAQVRCLAVD